MRKRNTNVGGGNWTQEEILAVWKKGSPVTGYDSNKVRKDSCGAWIEYAKYGETVEDGTGWEIDHVRPVAAGGTDAIANLQPLQWQNNRGKSDNWPQWSCLIKATG